MLFTSLSLSLMMTLPAQCIPAYSSASPVPQDSRLDATQAPITISAVQPLRGSSDPTSEFSSPLIMTYYPDWTELKPDEIPFSRLDWVDFAFAIPDKDQALNFDNEGDEELLKVLVKAAHGHGTKVKGSIGGWSGSEYFSSAVASNSSRERLAYNVLDFCNKFELDGVDFDWEYPGLKQGKNEVDREDTDRFLVFLRLLRHILPANVRLTAAGTTSPFSGPSGQPLQDVTEFAKVLDWVLIMNYDSWGSSGPPGPNAPLSDNCKNSSQPGVNAASGIEAWKAAGLPPKQIVLGVPSYGYVVASDATHLRERSYTERAAHCIESRDVSEGERYEVKSEDGGQVQFRKLVNWGVLVADGWTKDGLAKFKGGRGFEKEWDHCSSTPFLRSESSGQVIAFDDPESLAMKGALARDAGLVGVNMFDIHGDTNEWVLVDALRRGTSRKTSR